MGLHERFNKFIFCKQYFFYFCESITAASCVCEIPNLTRLFSLDKEKEEPFCLLRQEYNIFILHNKILMAKFKSDEFFSREVPANCHWFLDFSILFSKSNRLRI